MQFLKGMLGITCTLNAKELESVEPFIPIKKGYIHTTTKALGILGYSVEVRSSIDKDDASHNLNYVFFHPQKKMEYPKLHLLINRDTLPNSFKEVWNILRDSTVEYRTHPYGETKEKPSSGYSGGSLYSCCYWLVDNAKPEDIIRELNRITEEKAAL